MKAAGILILIAVQALTSCQFARTPRQPKTPQFEEQVLDAGVEIGYGLAIGDVDGDGKPDILLADKKQFVWYRNGDWQRFVMADSLTEYDNVCLAARDINGDGQVEVAVGAQWNPANTREDRLSGAVFYLIRPEDPTQLWEPVPLHHEPTVHRMHWVRVEDKYQLVVLPLHGRGNQAGHGDGVRVIAYQMPDDPKAPWALTVLDQSLHMTHNFDIVENDGKEALLVGGKEEARLIEHKAGSWSAATFQAAPAADKGFGEIRKDGALMAAIQPMHGHELVVYTAAGERRVLTDSLNQGHALAIADLLDQGQPQIVAAWRSPNKSDDVGIKLFQAEDEQWTNWQSTWIDRNGMACEDLKVADLNADGLPDVIAAGRDTKNLKVYWNRSR